MSRAHAAVVVATLGCGPTVCPPHQALLADGSCADRATPASPEAEDLREPLPPGRLARRLSLDLRGTLPTVAELDAAAADPASIDALREAWLDDPAFEARLVHILHESWHTRVDELLIHHFEFPQLADDDANEYPYERAVGEEPLRLMARVAATDAPWTDILLVDWTLAPPMLEALWPLERVADGGEGGWVEAHYTDARPAAGILSTNGLWWRYYTTATNYNRSRAATLARLLVCDDILARPVSFAAVEGPDDAGAEAVRTDPGCVGCHATVDPAAAALFGFYAPEPHTGADNALYHPERVLQAQDALGVAPAWYGRPVDGLGGLARAIAEDPRFPACTTETFAEALWRRPVRARDQATLQAAERTFRDDDLRLKALLRALTDAPAYRAGRDPTAATATDGENTVRRLSPEQLQVALADLTGLDWTLDGFAQLDQDTWGYRLMLGGVDGIQVASPQRDPSLTAAAVHRRLAWAAGSRLAQAALSGESTVLGEISTESAPGDLAFDAALAALVLRAHGQPHSAALADDLTALWGAGHDAGGAETAWTMLVAGVLRDPSFLTY